MGIGYFYTTFMRRHLFIVISIIASLLGLFIFFASDEEPASMAKPPSGFKEEFLIDRESYAARLFIKTCIQCHDLPNPKGQAADEWPAVVIRMLDRLQRRKVLSMNSKPLFLPSAEEGSKIMDYLSEYGFKKAPPHLTKDPSPPAALFVTICSQCHALPDPSQHTAAEWGTTLPRMEGHMAQMKKRALNEDERSTLLAFLSGQAKDVSPHP